LSARELSRPFSNAFDDGTVGKTSEADDSRRARRFSLLLQDNASPYPAGTCESCDTCAASNRRTLQSSRNDDYRHALVGPSSASRKAEAVTLVALHEREWRTEYHEEFDETRSPSAHIRSSAIIAPCSTRTTRVKGCGNQRAGKSKVQIRLRNSIRAQLGIRLRIHEFENRRICENTQTILKPKMSVQKFVQKFVLRSKNPDYIFED